MQKREQSNGRPNISPDCGKVVVLENETIVAVREGDIAALFLDYRLNILGIRVWEHSCQLIARSGKEWGTIGPRLDLPVYVPKDAEELKTAAAEPLRLTAYQYCAECPGSDLAEVLSETKDFSEAREDAAVPVAPAVAETSGDSHSPPGRSKSGSAQTQESIAEPPRPCFSFLSPGERGCRSV